MKIHVAGVGLTRFGELWNKSLEDLAMEAAGQAISDARIDKQKIGAIFVANMLSSKLYGQDHLGAVVTSALGINAAALRVEGACASGGLAVHMAVQSLLSGMYEHVLVVGVEKMTDVLPSLITTALSGAGSEDERRAGLTFPGLYALMARMHMQTYGTTREQMAAVAVKNHFHASLNDRAHFQFEISIEKVLTSPTISNPFTLFDASPISDGAAAVVLSSKPIKKGVVITGSAVATDTIGLDKRKNLTELTATTIAAKKAWKQSGVGVKNIDVMEVHDCFTIAEIMAMEDLGFCAKGEGGRFIESGQTRLGKKLPVNPSGGLKACGHPVGATGIKQIVEIVQQLRGVSGKRQVSGAKVGLTHNVGGTGATVVVHILQK